ncbi:polysaccharide biosynthesis protein [Rossellomorea aquimaris]|uniref:polysaccharide biosynthesis protein n=1 Tax=Rossellomorea aquimaris TaxID=189382 RepID=UPI0007D07773|nr:polysaccharide biosynthesis protein [Rossellomorea aquimaris]
MFENKTILITGATGSWGHELVRQLILLRPKEIRLFSRNEYAQVNMKRQFNSLTILKFLVGDVRDYLAVLNACENVDYVFHLAALKHVPVCEEQPLEAIKTNVTGTENVIRASIAQKVNKVVDVSSDKAVDPINFYGMTKAIGEKLVIQANQNQLKTKFVCIRGGNVLGTNGSVVPLFKNLLKENKDIPITSRAMTRFFLTINDAIKLLLTAAMESYGGETFVMKMKSCKMIDLAEVMIETLGKTSTIIDIGIRSGEKLHETLISKYESKQTYELNNDYYVILPQTSPEILLNKYKAYPKVVFEIYESNENLMSKEQIKGLLEQGGFLR